MSSTSSDNAYLFRYKTYLTEPEMRYDTKCDEPQDDSGRSSIDPPVPLPSEGSQDDKSLLGSDIPLAISKKKLSHNILKSLVIYVYVAVLVYMVTLSYRHIRDGMYVQALFMGGLVLSIIVVLWVIAGKRTPFTYVAAE